MIRVIIFFALVSLLSCFSKAPKLAAPIEIRVDSIYVNEKEKSDTIRDVLIVYYCTFKNSSDSVIKIPVRDAFTEELTDANIYLINSTDTVSLLLATSKPPVKISPRGEFHCGLGTNEFTMVDLFEKYGYSIEHRSKKSELTEMGFLNKIARQSHIIFKWRGFTQEIHGLEKVKVNYRNQSDQIVE